MEVTSLGAIIALIIAIILIIKRVPPAYGMMAGALIGGIIGGAGLSGTVSLMITGGSSMASSILRIMAAGILAGVLIESGAASTIAERIVNKIGESRALIAITLSTWALTSVGVFGDVACITVAPIAIQIAQRAGYSKSGIMLALIGGVHAGNVMSPNPNAIALAESFSIPLTSVMLAGTVPAIFGIIATCILTTRIKNKGSKVISSDMSVRSDESERPTLFASLIGPCVTIVLLALRPICGIIIDPLIALPAGGIVSAIAMKKTNKIISFASSGLNKMSGVVLLLMGTGTIAGIISNSGLKDLIISGVDNLGLPGFILAPIAGISMGAATASCTAGATVASQVFGTAILQYGVTAVSAAVMIHAGCCVFDCLPHGSFFHVSAGSVNMDIKERLKLIPYESCIGLIMTIVATVVFGIII